MNVRALIACAALIVAAAAAALYAEGRERAQQAVLSTELADFIVPANADRRDAAALRAAYAAALARLDPLFGMSGTDPDKLGESTDDLATYISRIASLYDRKERDIITRVWHPLSFLKGMAETERARQELIITPSLPHARAYYRLLGETIDSADEYAAELAEEFRTNTSFPTYTVAFIGGWSTPQLYAAALEDYRRDLTDKKKQFLIRAQCLNNFSEKCPSLTEAFAALTASSTISTSGQRPGVPQAVVDTTKIIRTHFSVASNKAGGAHGPLIVLNDSPCFTNVPLAYYQSWAKNDDQGKSFALYYVNDLYFYDAETYNTPQITPEIAKEIPYLYQSAANLYLCPASGDDLTRALALDTVAPLLMEDTGNDILYETDLVASLEKIKSRLAVGEKALAQELSEEEILALEKNVHIALERSPRFDEIIRDVLANNSLVEVLAARNNPVPLSALLMSRGYAPLLLLSYNASVSPKPLRLMAPRITNMLDSRLTSYNNVLKAIYSPEEILALMSRWRQVQFETP